MRSLADWLEQQQKSHPSAIDLDLDARARSGAAARSAAARLSRGHRRRHQRQGFDGRLPRRAAARRRHAHAGVSPRRTSRATTNASASTAWKPTTPSLIASFERIEAARGDITLTFFEYNALAALDLFRARARRRGGARGGARRPARRHQHRRCGRGRGLFDRPRSRRLAGRLARADRAREGRHLPRRAAGGARQRGAAARRCGRSSRSSARAPWCPDRDYRTRRPHGERLGLRVRRDSPARSAAAGACRAHTRSATPPRRWPRIAAGGFGIELTHADRQRRRCATCASPGAFSACRARSNGFSMSRTTCPRPRRCATTCARCRARAHARGVRHSRRQGHPRHHARRWPPRSTPGFS